MHIRMSRLWLGLGAVFGFAAVALSAWAAHGAPKVLDAPRLAVLSSALTMQGWHALALLAVGLWQRQAPALPVRLAGLAFALGVLLFCGAVYLSALGGVSLGPLAPIGGSLLMLGWLCLLWAALRR